MINLTLVPIVILKHSLIFVQVIISEFQGQERDIVILSCVRTDATGFLKSRNRLNVALTRARHSLFIIGDARCLSKVSILHVCRFRYFFHNLYKTTEEKPFLLFQYLYFIYGPFFNSYFRWTCGIVLSRMLQMTTINLTLIQILGLI